MMRERRTVPRCTIMRGLTLMVGDMHRSATNQSTAARTCAQFRESHPNGHNHTF